MRRAALLAVLFALSLLVVFQACTSREVVGVVVGAVGIQPPNATVYVGDSVQLAAVVQDDRGEVLRGATPEWSSSEPTVVTVGPNGVARGHRSGVADVSATFGSESATARIVVTPPAVFDFAVLESSGSTTVTEAGASDQLTITLLTQPSFDVVLEVTSDDPGEVVASPAVLTFQSSDWNVPQGVTVTGVDDELLDGDQVTNVVVAVDSDRSDPAFAGAAAKSVDVLTRDDESPSFGLASTGVGTSATEGGQVDTVTVVLDVEPTADVYLSVSVDDTADATVEPETLTFTRDDWDTPQVVVFSAVDDAVVDGTRSRTITVAVAPGSAPAFAGLSPRTLGATTVDNELTGLTLAHSGGATTAIEGGAPDSISVSLDTTPSSLVVLDISVSDPADAMVSPTTLTFTASGPMSQWVSFMAVDDPDLDGSRPHTITVSVNAASDAAFLDLEDRTIDAMTVDDDVAGFVVSESGGVTIVDEAGGTDTFTLVLASRPGSDVTLTISSGDPGEVVVSPAAVTFSPATWSQPQSITAAGVDDTLGDGDQATQITIAVGSGSAPAFAALPPRTLTVTTVDDDGVGFILGETDGTIVNEPGTLTDAIAVRLNAVPLANVVLDITAADPGEVAVTPTKLTFTPANAGQPQAVVVMGVNDLLADGDVASEVIVSVDAALTLDAAYDTVSAKTVYVTTLDDEIPSIVVAETGGSTSVEESGTSDAFTVILSAQPLGNVVLTVTSDDPGEVVADSATLTFTPSSWSTPKTVTVTGVDDGAPDGAQVTAIRLTVDDGASDDAWDEVADRVVSVTTSEVSASFTLTESGGATSVHESGLTDSFTVVLDGPPGSDVILTVGSADPGEVVADSATLTFTTASWSTPKTVTLTGVDDGVVDGPQVSLVSVAVNPLSDPDYVGLPPEVVSVTTTDDEVAAFVVTETGGATAVDEHGSTDAFTVVLSAQPLSNVVLTVSVADPSEVAADSATLTFTPANWSSPKTVTVMGVEDGVEDGDQVTPVVLSVDDESSDDLWDALPNRSVLVTTLDATAGFTVSETGGGTSVSESGTTDVFTVVLDEPPDADVVFTVTSSDLGEVAVDSATLTFTPGSWSISKVVTVTGVNDGVVDGSQVSTVTVAVSAGSDPMFAGLSPRLVSVTTTDDDMAGFEVTETGGSTSVDETGTSDAFNVVLSVPPLSNVVLTLSSADPAEAVTDSSTLTFTPATWNVAKTVTVTGADDDLADGAQVTAVTIAVDPASDGAFVGLPAQTVSVVTTDDEVADFAITQTQGSTVVGEGGTTDTFQVVLLARPSSSVTIVASSPDPGEVTVSPASISFPPGQWSSPRTFTVTGVDDSLADGAQVTLVLVAVDDATSNDVFDSAPDKTVSVTTLDDEVPGFTVTESGGGTSVSESGTTDSFAVVLDEQPVSTVILTITSQDEDEVTVSAPTVSFTTSDWSTPKQVTVMGVSDGATDGESLTFVTIAVDPASDPIYATVPPQGIAVITTDID